MDDVKAAAESMAQLLTNPQIRAAWLNYVAADAERYASLDRRVTDLSGNVSALRRDIDVAIDGAVRRALEGTELRVAGLGALVDAMNAFDKRLEALETRGDVRTAMLEEVIARLPPPLETEEAA